MILDDTNGQVRLSGYFTAGGATGEVHRITKDVRIHHLENH